MSVRVEPIIAQVLIFGEVIVVIPVRRSLNLRLLVLTGERVDNLAKRVIAGRAMMDMCGSVLLVSMMWLRRRGREVRLVLLGRTLCRTRLPRLLGLQLQINLRSLLSCIWLPLLLRLPLPGRRVVGHIWLPLPLKLRMVLHLRRLLALLLKWLYEPLRRRGLSHLRVRDYLRERLLLRCYMLMHMRLVLRRRLQFVHLHN